MWPKLPPSIDEPNNRVEVELSAAQFEIMGYPNLRQGQPLSLLLDGGVLLPDEGIENWYVVQQEPLPQRWIQVGPGTVAFSGLIEAAELVREPGYATAVLLVRCGEIPLRVTCGPDGEGAMPDGVWETRFIAGCCRVQGIASDDFAVPIGEEIGMTLWGVRRLVLTPDDPLFGEWHESDALPPTPFRHDRVFLTVRPHRSGL